MLLLAGCQSGGQDAVDIGVGGEEDEESAEKISASELRAFCPPVNLREGTAYFNTYEGGAEGDDSKVVYQASIADVTRTCDYARGGGTVTVVVAGKIVPGPAGHAGTVTMPIRVVAVRGEEVVYSELHRHEVRIDDTSGATQFIFKDSDVAIPDGIDLGVRVYAGYDEGPYDSP